MPHIETFARRAWQLREQGRAIDDIAESMGKPSLPGRWIGIGPHVDADALLIARQLFGTFLEAEIQYVVAALAGCSGKGRGEGRLAGAGHAGIHCGRAPVDAPRPAYCPVTGCRWTAASWWHWSAGACREMFGWQPGETLSETLSRHLDKPGTFSGCEPRGEGV